MIKNITISHDLNVADRMRRILPSKTWSIIKEIARIADTEGYKAYIVGGFVRDLLLGAGNLDIDIVIEGDALKFAESASLKLNTALLLHKRFGTAALIMRRKPKIKIDIASARRESYKRPGALPSTAPGSLKDDLYRRDFTINAMAVSINPEDFGRLIDFFGGMEDLARKKIRILHKNSFIDDPMRVFRAVRFEGRYCFKIDSRTSSLIRDAVKTRMFDKVSGERLRAEVELLFREKDPVNLMKSMRNLDELKFISPKIRLGAAQERIGRNIKAAAGLYGRYFSKERPLDLWLVYFMALIDSITFCEAMKVCNRFMMRRGEKSSITAVKKSGGKVIAFLSTKGAIGPSSIYDALSQFSPEALLFIAAKCASRRAKSRVGAFLKKYRHVNLSIGGDDIKRFCRQTGPHFGEILKKTLYAKIDGVVTAKKDEMVFAERLCSSCCLQ